MVRSFTKTRRRNSHSSKHLRKNRNNRDEAGQAIAAGGFGCVFKPAIKCGNSFIASKMKKAGYDYITKVMSSSNANDEMKEVVMVLPIVSKIPNDKRYFLVDGIFECKNFGPLTSEDLNKFDSKCTNLNKIGILASNINSNLSKLSALYIPYGGESVANAMKELANSYNKVHDKPALLKDVAQDIGILSYALADVLEHAIVPMNKLDLIHLDLKGDNLLFNSKVLDDGKMPYIKVIDWGLAGKVPSSTYVAPAAKNRPLQFNAPFSNILFNALVIDMAIKSHSNGHIPIITEAQMPLIATSIVKMMIKNWEGHARFISQDLKNLMAPFIINSSSGQVEALSSSAKCPIEALTVIVNYITPILKKFWRKDANGMYSGNVGSFLVNEYFQEVYRWNCDVWGVIICYQDFIGRISSYSLHRNSEIVKAMSNIIFKYCLSPTYAAKRIPVEDVVKDMQSIARICGVMRKPTPESSHTPLPVPEAATIDIVQLPDKKTKANLNLRAVSPNKGSPQTVSLKGKKRCPAGYSKHPSKPGKCRKTVKKAKKASPKKNVTNKNVVKHSPHHITLPLGRKRCPTGYSKVSGDSKTTQIICVKK